MVAIVTKAARNKKVEQDRRLGHRMAAYGRCLRDNVEQPVDHFRHVRAVTRIAFEQEIEAARGESPARISDWTASDRASASDVSRTRSPPRLRLRSGPRQRRSHASCAQSTSRVRKTRSFQLNSSSSEISLMRPNRSRAARGSIRLADDPRRRANRLAPRRQVGQRDHARRRLRRNRRRLSRLSRQ